MNHTAEHQRLSDDKNRKAHWRLWGPYLSERQWGTVREDYSAGGTAWEYFPHDHARSRAYRWGEDGLLGISDNHQRLCFALALWNGKDTILKERLFGLTGNEGNHGEDVKEYYFYLDNTPTHSYMKALYKYPQAAFPYAQLLEENKRRSRLDPEYELVDTGIFNDNRYFDVQIEYAKNTPDDLLIQITATNHGPDAAPLNLIPMLWFRNTWIWGRDSYKPSLSVERDGPQIMIRAEHKELGTHWLYVEKEAELLFTENETNNARLFGGSNSTPFVKDGINEYIVNGRRDAVNPVANRDESGRSAPGHDSRRQNENDSPASRRFRARARRAGIRVRDSACRTNKRIGCVSQFIDSGQFFRRPQKHPAPSARRHVVVETVLSLHRRRLVARRSGVFPAAAATAVRPQQSVDAFVQRRHSLDARHVGISLVRGVGLGVSPRFRLRWSMPSSRNASLICSRASGTCIRTDKFPPTSGRSAT